MENAQKIAVNTKHHGTYEEGEAWFFFKTGEPEPEEVVLEVPFELNETQVRFVADQLLTAGLGN